jgi:hypothetical protein
LVLLPLVLLPLVLLPLVLLPLLQEDHTTSNPLSCTETNKQTAAHFGLLQILACRCSTML